MLIEQFEEAKSTERTPGGYCLTGRTIKLAFGASSQQFYDHKVGCTPCTKALDHEQQKMKREYDAAKRDGKV